MFNKILLATDFSKHAENARTTAIQMARGTDLKITVLNSFDLHQKFLDESVLMASDLVEKAENKHIRREAEKKMEEYCKPLKDAGIEFETLIKEGKPGKVIVTEAEKLDVDLIVIGSHSKRGFVDVSLGGVARFVGEHAPCPVMIVTKTKNARVSTETNKEKKVEASEKPEPEKTESEEKE
ncbi:MAG: universal stress protein [Vulcanimicrobiota bacterium]